MNTITSTHMSRTMNEINSNWATSLNVIYITQTTHTYTIATAEKINSVEKGRICCLLPQHKFMPSEREQYLAQKPPPLAAEKQNYSA